MNICVEKQTARHLTRFLAVCAIQLIEKLPEILIALEISKILFNIRQNTQ